MTSRLLANKIHSFDTCFEAWVHGPFCPELYNKYKIYGSSDIDKYTEEIVVFSEAELNVLSQVKEIYGKYSGDELENIIQQEIPWKNARKDLMFYEPSNNPILDLDIFESYITKCK